LRQRATGRRQYQKQSKGVDNRWQSFVPHDCSTPFSSNFPNYAATGTGYLELHTYKNTRTYVLLTFIFVWVDNYSASARCFCTPQCKMQSSLGSFQQTNKANEISNISRGRNNHTYLGQIKEFRGFERQDTTMEGKTEGSQPVLLAIFLPYEYKSALSLKPEIKVSTIMPPHRLEFV